MRFYHAVPVLLERIRRFLYFCLKTFCEHFVNILENYNILAFFCPVDSEEEKFT